MLKRCVVALLMSLTSISVLASSEPVRAKSIEDFPQYKSISEKLKIISKNESQRYQLGYLIAGCQLTHDYAMAVAADRSRSSGVPDYRVTRKEFNVVPAGLRKLVVDQVFRMPAEKVYSEPGVLTAEMQDTALKLQLFCLHEVTQVFKKL